MTKKTNSDEQLCEYASWRESCSESATYTVRTPDGKVWHMCKQHAKELRKNIGSLSND